MRSQHNQELAALHEQLERSLGGAPPTRPVPLQQAAEAAGEQQGQVAQIALEAQVRLNHTPQQQQSNSHQRLREELACAYQVFAMLRWEDSIHTHITCKVPGVPGAEDTFLISPYGLMWDEITACTLVEVRTNGDIVDGGTTGLGINPGSFKLHSALHTISRESDIAWVMHAHYRACCHKAYYLYLPLPTT